MTDTTVTLPRADLLELREALVTKVIWAPQERVAEINRAIALADIHLGIDSTLARMRREEPDFGSKAASDSVYPPRIGTYWPQPQTDGDV